MEHLDANWDDRIPCVDEACTGIIGANGTCGMCGLKYEGEVPLPASETTDDAESPPFPEASVSATDGEEFQASEDDRVCCSDESCIGIISANGICGTCGKSASPPP